MAFVLASTSALDMLFEQRSRRLLSEASSSNFQAGSQAPIRRPYRGIQIKDDTYATMSIVDGAGKPVQIVSESAVNWPEDNKGRVNVYADFVLQQITEERTEKNQIIETFGDSFIFFFGERPRILTIQGILVNTDDFGWRAQFMHNYENVLRGSKLVQRNARLYLSWDTIVVEGYPINVSASEDSTNPYSVNFQMQIFLTNYNDFGRIGITDFPAAPRDTRTFDALNRELSEKDAFISTTTAVRRLNFESRGQRNGLGGFFREGIRQANNITNIASNAIQTAATILSGRVVRTPLGIAGFLNQLGQGGVAAVGLQTDPSLTSFAFEGLTDTKLFIPRRPQFAVADESLLRTQISENFDEYPLVAGAGVPTLWDPQGQLAFTNRRAARELKQVEQAAVLTLQATMAQAEAKALDTVQDLVLFTRTGFALFNTTKAVLEDPLAVAADSLGLSGIV